MRLCQNARSQSRAGCFSCGLSAVTGWEVSGGELRETARRIVMAKRVYNIREGWQPEDDWLPDRLLNLTGYRDIPGRQVAHAWLLLAQMNVHYAGTGIEGGPGFPRHLLRCHRNMMLLRVGQYPVE